MPRAADLAELLTRAERLMARRLKAVLDELGYSPDAWRVLTLLADGAGHHMTEISEAAFLPPATLTKLVDQLVEHNLVYRRVDPVDRRRIRAYLSPRGQDAHAQIASAIERSWAALATPDADDDLLAILLHRLTQTLTHDQDVPQVVRAT